ncbi:uncharacterized protein LOC134816635 [Bolinopsis microptera]|uniref:uncharacterized protein LOC134816635 n=1 Tax=Bolinopsis microptera TaxID=2820187 RepID=UPI0030797BFB
MIIPDDQETVVLKDGTTFLKNTALIPKNQAPTIKNDETVLATSDEALPGPSSVESPFEFDGTKRLKIHNMSKSGKRRKVVEKEDVFILKGVRNSSETEVIVPQAFDMNWRDEEGDHDIEIIDSAVCDQTSEAAEVRDLQLGNSGQNDNDESEDDFEEIVTRADIEGSSSEEDESYDIAVRKELKYGLPLRKRKVCNLAAALDTVNYTVQPVPITEKVVKGILNSKKPR